MSAETLTRREREKIRQRQAILAAALILFSEKGYHNVSVQEIAQKAEFAIGTLYKFFKNKEDLYQTLIMEQCDAFERSFTRALDSGGDEIEKLRNYVRIKGERVRESLAFIRLFLAESRGVSFTIKAGMNETLRKRHEHFLEKLAAVFDSGIKAGRFRDIAAPRVMAVALDSTINALLQLWLDAPEKHPYPDDPDTILNIFFNGLLTE